MQQNHLFCFGLGYSAQVLAQRLLADNWRVSATCRSVEKIENLKGVGINAYRFDDYHPLQNITSALQDVTHLMSSIPPGESGDGVFSLHAAELAGAAHNLKWIGYLSTVGVYGDQQGRWIDEACDPQPTNPRSRQRLLAEEQWLGLGKQLGVPAHVFRLPGIYGPGGRNQISALKAGRARRIIKPGQVFNRIHVHDLASVLMASMYRPGGSQIYNLADDEPAAAEHIVSYAAELLGVDPPAQEMFEDADLSPFAKSFYSECKRIRNDRIKRELEVKLLYPTYREGLAAIAADADKQD